MACSHISFLNLYNLKSSQSFSLGAATFAFKLNGLQAVSFDTHCFWVSAPSSTRSPVQSQLFPLCVLGTPQWLRGWRSPIEAALIATLKLNWTAQSEYIHTHTHRDLHTATHAYTHQLNVKCFALFSFQFFPHSLSVSQFTVYKLQRSASPLNWENSRKERLRVQRSGGTRALLFKVAGNPGQGPASRNALHVRVQRRVCLHFSALTWRQQMRQ